MPIIKTSSTIRESERRNKVKFYKYINVFRCLHL